ncbi:MAG TPA: hypothetical protein VMT34_11945 [Aggregatilineales bacterium]|nr:hypothetical protein [Aggregatilineales bacterium]
MPSVIPPSGFYYPNIIAHIYLEAMQKLIGADAVTQVLRENGLDRYIGAFPPNNLQRQFDFACFATLIAALDEMAPLPGHRESIAAEVGRLCFKGGNKAFGGLSGLGAISLGFQSLPMEVKVKNGLIAMAVTFTTLSDQHSDLEDHDDHFAYVIHRCPVCWGRQGSVPMCDTAGAMLDEGLYWATGAHFSITETTCCGLGGESCTFEILKTPRM